MAKSRDLFQCIIIILVMLNRLARTDDTNCVYSIRLPVKNTVAPAPPNSIDLHTQFMTNCQQCTSQILCFLSTKRFHINYNKQRAEIRVRELINLRPLWEMVGDGCALTKVVRSLWSLINISFEASILKNATVVRAQTVCEQKITIGTAAQKRKEVKKYEKHLVKKQTKHLSLAHKQSALLNYDFLKLSWLIFSHALP